MNKISIVTPCFNAEKYIAETIQSVLTNMAVIQNKIELEYIICDGKSTDKTIEIVDKLFSKNDLDNISTEIISENDSGMYDALSKGLKKATGEITAYINAGDSYSPHAFEIVFEIMNGYPVKWLTGLIVIYNEKSHIIEAFLPYKYRKKFIKHGIYNHKILPFIQQESTFWKTELNDLINYNELSQFCCAGDNYIWNIFSQIEDLHIVEAWLGGFKFHKGQLSEDKSIYYKEMKQITLTPGLREVLLVNLEKIIWKSPTGLKKLLNRQTLFRFDHKSQKYILP